MSIDIPDLNNLNLAGLDAETRKLLHTTQTENDDTGDHLRKLEDKLANLSLVTEALWNLLNKRTRLTEADLNASITEVVQQRKNREATKLLCAKCNMHNAVSHKKCIYCGGALNGHQGKNLFGS